MKKIILILALIVTAITGANAKGNKIPLYAWNGFGDNARLKPQERLQGMEASRCHRRVHQRRNGHRKDCDSSQSRQEGRLGVPRMGTHNGAGRQGQHMVHRKPGANRHSTTRHTSPYTTLDPRNPKVKEFRQRNSRRLPPYPEVDFVQLDYIRYADVILPRSVGQVRTHHERRVCQADYCYCNDCVAAFKQQSGIDITKVTDPSKIKEWAQFRCDAVTDLVNAISDAVHAAGKKISADVFPRPEEPCRVDGAPAMEQVEARRCVLR